jgi:thiol:disulfide interchange protein DsbC
VALCVAAAVFYSLYREANRTPDEIAAEVLESADGEIDLNDLPLQQAIRQVHGDGELIVVTFEDPNCPFCTRLDEKLAHLDNVTIYTFLLPILSEDSDLKSRQIWCAQDRSAAWNGWMLKRQIPPGNGDCDTGALALNLAIGERLGIQGVPYLLRAKR